MAKTKAVGVIRVSTARQADEDHFGVEAQQTAILKLAKLYDLDLVETISYNDVSGADVMYAPEMQHLLRLIQRPDITAVVAKEFSRLVRPGFEDYPLLAKFVSAGVTLYLPSGPLNIADAHGAFMATIHGAMAALELHTIKSRLMGGREESRKLGFAAAGGMTIPSGMLWDVKTKTWSHDAVYSPKIRRAFEMVAAAGVEANLSHIIRELQLRLRTSQGESRELCSVTALKRLLSNRLFIGERVYDKKFDLTTPKNELLHEKNGKLHRRNRPLIARQPDDVLRRQVIPPDKALVSLELFERVQTILRAKTDKRHQSHALRQPRERFTYRGLLFCGECGDPLYSVSANERSQYYRCRDHFPIRGGTRKCKSPSMQRATLEAAVDQFVSKEVGRTEFFKRVLEKNAGAENRRDLALRRDRLQTEQQALAKKRERIVEHSIEGVITREDRDRRLKAVDADLDLNRRELQELADAPAMPNHAEWQRMMRPFMRGFTGLPVEEKRRLISSRFQQITIRDGRVVNWYLLTGELATPKPELRPLMEADPTKCYNCGHALGKSLQVDPRENYCSACEDECSYVRSTREPELPEVDPEGLALTSQRVTMFNDTSRGLQPLRSLVRHFSRLPFRGKIFV